MAALTVSSRVGRPPIADISLGPWDRQSVRSARCSLPLRVASLAHAGAVCTFDAKFGTAVNRVRETLTTWVERGRGYICVRRSRDA
jgi:hypothetical protein